GPRPVYPSTMLAAGQRLPVEQLQPTPEEWNGLASVPSGEQSRSLMPSRRGSPTQPAVWQTREPPTAAPPAPAATAEAPPPPVTMLHPRRIPFNFSADNAGPNPPEALELWYTHNGGPWQKHPTPPPAQPPYTVEVAEDGVYGFCLVASGPGAGPPP